jgi:bifunctional non-homologous end joining protein LigD
MGLREYRRKRDFTRTPEPAGAERPGRKVKKLGYVIQAHAARRMHYDFRLELDGVLKSWAVPKGPSLDPNAKRLAVHVEDHPIEYGEFEGVIPAGEYGGGTVMLWDRGWWEPIGDGAQAYAKGHLKFTLHGTKLNGAWALVRMKGRREGDKGDNWLLIKEQDASAMPGSDDAVVVQETRSASTGRDMAAIAAQSDRVWSSKQGGETKANAKAAPKKAAAKRGATQATPSAPLFDPSHLAGAKQVKSAPRLAPQLASAAEVAPRGDEWLHEIKFDGYRMLAYLRRGKVELRSRKDLDWTAKFPEIAEVLSGLALDEAVLDGEIVQYRDDGISDFSALQNALAERKTGGLVYMAFDLLFLAGWDLTGVALEERKAALRSVLAADPQPTIRYSDHQIGKGPDFLTAACDARLEGIVSKRRDGRHQPGRGSSWLKAKCGKREDLVIVGFTDPAGERAGFGALLMGYHTAKGALVYAGRVGTGFGDKLLDEMRRRLAALEQRRATVKLPAGLSARGTHWVKPELVAEVTFSGWTADGILRQSSFVGLRDDKSPDEVVLDPLAAPSATSPAPAPTPARIGRDGAAVVAGIRVTHAAREVYPEPGITKLALAEFYAGIAEHILPHVVHRPLSLLRCPDGVTGQRFFQKHVMPGTPAAIKRTPVPMKDGIEDYVMIEDAAGLVALVQMSVLEIHPWGSTIDNLEKPDRLTFDLDPDEGLRWDQVVAGAVAVRDFLDSLGLRSFVKTTGGKGLHVVVPVKPALEWDAAKEFTRVIVSLLVDAGPTLYTASMVKKARRGRIFIDYLRNGRGATAVAAYSTRARADATVSVPVSWAEIESGLRSDRFTVLTLPDHLRARTADPWAELAGTKQVIAARVLKKLGIA